jgi:hypothetical protein
LPAQGTEGAVMHPNGRIYASGLGTLLMFDESGLIGAVGSHPGAHDVIVDADGNIWIADTGNRRLVKYTQDLDQLMILDGPEFGFLGPRYLDLTEFGELIVADQDAHRILKINPAAPEGARRIGVLGDGLPGIGAMKFDDPEGVVARGNRYWFADSDNNRIVRYSVVIN